MSKVLTREWKPVPPGAKLEIIEKGAKRGMIEIRKTDAGTEIRWTIAGMFIAEAMRGAPPQTAKRVPKIILGGGPDVLSSEAVSMIPKGCRIVTREEIVSKWQTDKSFKQELIDFKSSIWIDQIECNKPKNRHVGIGVAPGSFIEVIGSRTGGFGVTVYECEDPGYTAGVAYVKLKDTAPQELSRKLRK